MTVVTTADSLCWDTSIKGTQISVLDKPLHIIFVSVTCIRGTGTVLNFRNATVETSAKGTTGH